MSLYRELQRRNVLRSSAAYIAVSWVIVQVMEALFPLFDVSPQIARMVVVVLAVGFVPALVVSWVFEWTPQGLRRDRDLQQSAQLGATDTRAFDRFIILSLVLAVTLFAVDKFVLEPQRDQALARSVEERIRAQAGPQEQAPLPSIAVLPFRNNTDQARQEYLADGMTEEILNRLTRIRQIRVISRSSSFYYKDREIRPGQIAEELGVQYHLDGSIRAAGDRLRIAVDLVDSVDNTSLWSTVYDRAVNDVFAIQDDIAQQVVEALEISLLNESPRPDAPDIQAYLLYLEGIHALHLAGGADHLLRAIELLRDALRHEPRYLPAMHGLLVAYYRNSRQSPSAQGAAEWIAQGDALLARALDVEPDNPVSQAFIAWDHMETDNDLQRAADAFTLAIEGAPFNEDVIRGGAFFARHIGRPGIAIALGENAASRNPRCAQCFYALSQAYRDVGEFEAARDRVAMAKRLGLSGLDYSEAVTLLQQGRAEQALAVFEELGGQGVQLEQGILLALSSLGREEAFQAALGQWLEQRAADFPAETAQVYAWSGQSEPAIQWFNRAIDQDVFLAASSRNSYFFHSLRGRSGWNEALQRIGRSPAQLAAIRFEPQIP